MPQQRNVAVSDLSLDLNNFRTVHQRSERSAIEAIISISPDRFWAIAESLIESGYLPTENIIVLDGGDEKPSLTVKEGNRRIAALKLLLRQVPVTHFDIPKHIDALIKNTTSDWREVNSSVPCAIYERSEQETVDKIVALTHGKSEKAGRDKWNAVAGARHNREMNGGKEYGLDLLEQYLKTGKNLTDRQRLLWAGVYPLSVLDEAIKRVASRLNLASAAQLPPKYPSLRYRGAIENILHDIGTERLGFPRLRDGKTDFGEKYGLPPLGGDSHSGDDKAQEEEAEGGRDPNDEKGKPKTKGRPARATTDSRSVRRQLRAFKPRGKGREKVAALRDEAVKLDVRETPMAFCFVLRSLFEISAKAYCDDHKGKGGPSVTDAKGRDKPLADLLVDVTHHLTKNGVDREKSKLLHGASTELKKPHGLLSVTSLNQLVHNPRFSVAPEDISRLFNNVFPLIEEMNA
jgi:hypothetical protein